MLYNILIDFLGQPPVGYDFLYKIFAFILFLLSLFLVSMIFNSFFKIFKKGR